MPTMKILSNCRNAGICFACCSDDKFSNEYARPRGPAVLKRHAGTRMCHAGDLQSFHVHFFFFLAFSSDDSSDVVSI